MSLSVGYSNTQQQQHNSYIKQQRRHQPTQHPQLANPLVIIIIILCDPPLNTRHKGSPQLSWQRLPAGSASCCIHLNVMPKSRCVQPLEADRLSDYAGSHHVRKTPVMHMLQHHGQLCDTKCVLVSQLPPDPVSPT
jgi:hypothetical protein